MKMGVGTSSSSKSLEAGGVNQRGRRLKAEACQRHLTEAGTGARLATSPHELLAMATAVGAASLPIRETSGPL